MVQKYTPELTSKVVKTKVGNYLGLQPARYILAKIVRNFRRFIYKIGKKNTIKSDEYIIKNLRKNGYVSIENFLDKSESESLRKEFDFIFDEPLGEDLTIEDAETIVRRRGLAINSIDNQKLSSVFNLVNSSFIWRVLSGAHGSVFKKENSTYWFDVIENGEKPCSVNIRHTDVFFDTYKIWYFLDDVKVEDGPLVFCPGSHKFSLWRMGFEYFGSLPDKNGIISQPYQLTDNELEKSGYKEKAFTVPANTLVIVNTHGFHRRGSANPGSTRRQVHFSARGTAFN